MTKRYSAGAFLGTALQIVPTAVIVITDTVPPWARWTLAAWLLLWAVLTVANATADTR